VDGDHPWDTIDTAGTEIRVGVTRLEDPAAQRIPVAEIFVNGGYGAGLPRDIALLRLAHAVTVTDKVRPVTLSGSDDRQLLDGTGRGTATGWGVTVYGGVRPEVLQEVELDILDDGQCRQIAPDGRVICTGSPPPARGVCYGDSGGPFVARADGGWIQIGVVSAFRNGKCEDPGTVVLMTQVSAYDQWIADKMATGAQDRLIVHEPVEVVSASDIVTSGLEAVRTYVEPRYITPTPSPSPTRTPTTTRTPTVTPSPTRTATPLPVPPPRSHIALPVAHRGLAAHDGS